MDLLSNKIKVINLIRYSKERDDLLPYILNESHFSNMAKLELMLISKEISTNIWIDNREDRFKEINTNLISFLGSFLKNDFEIKNFFILTDLNGLKWNDLHRKYQRKIEENYIECNMIRPGVTDINFALLLKNLNS